MPKPTVEPAADIPLDAKLRPTQARAQDTYEVVLVTAGELLIESGFEQLTTNAICKRAGLTPPALYRYFPNKYAILKELGDRLMRLQDEAVFAWMEAGGLEGETASERVAKTAALLTDVIDMTRRFPGGAAIGRALRAVPMLQQLRFASRDMVAGQFGEVLAGRFPSAPAARIRTATRMMVELTYAATEMAVEEPGEDAQALAREIGRLFDCYFETFDQEI
ncbi:TetR family transcriptional regulator [Caulobacter flavus]|uniref:TetR family transcriptional regulator n=1 Tax=Caulobacter flavus TaxID=1679497 RepID=A0A2N5D587_9CAUL|nr:TetR/AcrR family transcriptional regulator [Caulobacter flavus]AYV47160.1 TetR family transcriptional regulator [Caulobacter flavus]PLR21136.1 TetR family transcriptional regulator [Caulobacter flavus]